jgi:DNA-binding IclR family transcriptional regulator
MLDSASPTYTVPALERGLLLLGQFSRQTPSLTPPELARRLDLPRATVFRLLSTLEALGFVERTEGGRGFRLGVAVLRLGFEYLASLELTQLGTPLLQRVCNATGFPCSLVVRDGRSIVYVAKVAPPSPFSGSVTVGTRLPAHATVFGHVLLGDLDLPSLQALYPDRAAPLEAFTERTPTDVPSLHRMTQAARADGHLVGRGFFEPQIATVAAPVFDARGRITAALGITVPASALDSAGPAGGSDPLAPLHALLPPVREAAQALSRLLDHAPEP